MLPEAGLDQGFQPLQYGAAGALFAFAICEEGSGMSL